MKLNKFLFVVFFLVLLSSFSLAILPSQEYSKIFLDPFYRQSMDAQDYSYSLIVDSPDGFSSVASAIVTFQMWLNPTIEFSLLVNGQSCNNPVYEVHTTYAGAGEGNVFFDCSNVITANGVYDITLTPDDNTGAVTGWVDLTYTNSPSGDIEVMGTEYQSGDAGQVFLQLSENGIPVDNATCRVSIFNPNGSYWVNNQAMINGELGLQYYPFVAPEPEGVYKVSANCEYYSQDEFFFDLSGDEDFPDRIVIRADSVVGSPFNLNGYADNLWTESDALRVVGDGYYSEVNYNFTHDIITNVSDAVLYWLGEGTSDAMVSFYWYNWTSASYQLLPNSLVLSGTVSPQSLESSGVSELVTNDLPSSAINDDGTIMIKVLSYDNNQDFTLYSNWLNIRSSQLTGEYPNLLRGGGEIVIDNSENEIISNFESNFNYTNFLINYSRDYLSMQLDDNTTSILEAIAQVSFEANNDTGLILDALNSYFSTLNTSWFGWYDDLLQEHYDTQDLIVNLSIDLNNDYLSLLSQHNLTQGLIDDFRLNVSDEFDITNSLILTEAQALNDSLVSEFNFINNLILSSYTNITGDLSSVTSDIANIDSDLQDHDSDIKDRLDDLESYCDAQFVIVNNKLDLILEKLNIVTSDLNLFAETHDCMEGSVWSIDVTATDNFANYLNFEDINCNITTDIWGTAPLVWDVDSFDYTHECGYGNDTITWVVECDEI